MLKTLFFVVAAAAALSSLPATAQMVPKETIVAQAARTAAPRAPTAASVGEADMVGKVNNWTVGMAAGLPEGTFLPFAAEIARNLNTSDDLRVLPIVTPGATDNIKDLLYLKGVDLAITHTDVFEHFRTVEKISNIEKRVNYITGLYVSEIHLVVRPEINSIADLAGKKVGMHTAGSGSTVTGPIVFQRMGVKVEPVFVSNAIA